MFTWSRIAICLFCLQKMALSFFYCSITTSSLVVVLKCFCALRVGILLNFVDKAHTTTVLHKKDHLQVKKGHAMKLVCYCLAIGIKMRTLANLPITFRSVMSAAVTTDFWPITTTTTTRYKIRRGRRNYLKMFFLCSNESD